VDRESLDHTDKTLMKNSRDQLIELIASEEARLTRNVSTGFSPLESYYLLFRKTAIHRIGCSMMLHI
jgi:hypothetical protein